LFERVWLAPSIIVGVVCFGLIGRPDWWQDELITVDVTRRSFAKILELVQKVDAVHAAYYLFMHGWVEVFGSSQLSLRAPAALAMAGAAGCVAAIGQRLFGRMAGLLGALTLGLVPAIVRFGQEARSYGFVVLLATVATLLVLRAVERSTPWRWLAYGLCVAGLALFNLVAVTIVAGHLVGILTRVRRRSDLRPLVWFGLAVGLALALVSKVILLGMRQATRQVNWIGHDPIWDVWPRAFASTGVAVGVTVLAVVGCVRFWPKAAFPAAVAVVPVLVIQLASLGELSYLFSKYLLFIVPAWALLAGAGLSALRLPARPGSALTRWLVPLAALAVLGGLALPGQVAMHGRLSHSWYTYPDPRPEKPFGYRDAAKIIVAGYRPGDGIVYQRTHWWAMADIGVTYYFPDGVRPRDIFQTRTAADADDLNSVECAVPADCIGTERRLWVVIPSSVSDVMFHFPTEQSLALRAHYRQIDIRYASGMTVGLLERVG
jgi:mannosyltransferase